MLNDVLHVLSIIDVAFFLFQKNGIYVTYTLSLKAKIKRPYDCIDRNAHRIIELINQKFSCEKRAIWNRSAPKIYETEGSVVKLNHVRQSVTSRNGDREKKIRRRLRLFELFERKEAGFVDCAYFLFSSFYLFCATCCLYLFKKISKKCYEKERITSIKDGERYEFNSIIWCMFNCLECGVAVGNQIYQPNCEIETHTFHFSLTWAKRS